MVGRLFLIQDWVSLLRSDCQGLSKKLIRKGVIRAYAPLYHPPKMSIEYRRHGKDEDNEGPPLGPLMYQRAPLVPAATYLRTLIKCYRSLDRIPLWEQYWLGEHYHWRSSDYQETVSN